MVWYDAILDKLPPALAGGITGAIAGGAAGGPVGAVAGWAVGLIAAHEKEMAEHVGKGKSGRPFGDLSDDMLQVQRAEYAAASNPFAGRAWGFVSGETAKQMVALIDAEIAGRASGKFKQGVPWAPPDENKADTSAIVQIESGRAANVRNVPVHALVQFVKDEYDGCGEAFKMIEMQGKDAEAFRSLLPEFWARQASRDANLTAWRRYQAEYKPEEVKKSGDAIFKKWVAVNGQVDRFGNAMLGAKKIPGATDRPGLPDFCTVAEAVELRDKYRSARGEIIGKIPRTVAEEGAGGPGKGAAGGALVLGAVALPFLLR